MGNSTSKEGPGPSSLFNIDTLQALLNTGASSVDITVEKEQPFSAAVSSRQEAWTELSVSMGFCGSLSVVREPEASGLACDNKKVYMLWLWLETLQKRTFER